MNIGIESLHVAGNLFKVHNVTLIATGIIFKGTS
jgi:hypothetical protein